MGFIRAYLRVSTIEQDVLRAKAEIITFTNSHNQQISNYYLEQFTGTSLDRPELNRLLNDVTAGDIILIESVDRISRLKNDDWLKLKNIIEATRSRRCCGIRLTNKSHCVKGAGQW